jgi:serine/threonine protein kinase
MQIRCPHCNQVLNAPDDADVEQGKCPHCGEVVDIKAAERVGIGTGDVLGDFRVDRLIGRGGMAAVYRGTQVSLDRPVAVKVLASQLAKRSDFVERFHREAKVLAQLSHHNVVSVLAVGEHEKTYYLVMEYVEGESLRARLTRDGSIPFAEAVGLIDGVAAGLEYAHNHDVLHRDIKPGNILITAEGVPKIADFGLARLTGADEAAQQRLTMARTRMGSAHYMAPEQMHDAAAADHRADIYALGVMFYEMLTGKLPMGRFAPASKTPGVPRAVDRILHQALTESPDERIQTAAQFRALVQRLSLIGQPTRVQEGGHAPRRHHHEQKKSPMPLILGAVGLLVAAVVAFFALRGGEPEPQVKQPPEKQGAVKPDRPDRPKGPTDAETRETAAKKLYADAARSLESGDAATAKRQLAQLEQDYGRTSWHEKNGAAIARLRAEVEAALAPPKKPDTTKTEVVEPPVTPPPVALPEKAVQLPPPDPEGWVSLFDGKTLKGWRIPGGGHFLGDVASRVSVADGAITIGAANEATGIVCTQDVPRMDYDLSFDVMCTKGGDLAASPIFPVGAAFTMLSIKTGRGLGLGFDQASVRKPAFEPHAIASNRWHSVQLKVRRDRLTIWLDGRAVLDTPTGGVKFGHWAGYDPAHPVGFVTVYSTEARLRNIRLRRVEAQAAVAGGPRFFHGAVNPLPDARVEFRYDWSDRRQLDDWTLRGKFTPEIVDGEVRFGGGGARYIRHKAILTGDMEISASYRIRKAGGHEASACARVCANAKGAYSVQMMTGVQKLWLPGRIAGGRAQCPQGETHTLRLVRRGDAVEVWSNGTLATQGVDDVHKSGITSLGSWNTDVGFRDVRIVGTLDPAWLAANPEAKKQIDGILSARKEAIENDPARLYARGAAELEPLWQKRQYAEALAKARELGNAELVEDAEALAALWEAVRAGAAKLKPGDPFRIRGMAGKVTKVEDDTIHAKAGAAELGVKLTQLDDAAFMALARKGHALTSGQDLLALALLEIHAKKPSPAKVKAALSRAAKAGVDVSRHGVPTPAGETTKPVGSTPTKPAPAPTAEKWVNLFDGKSLGKWEVTRKAPRGEGLGSVKFVKEEMIFDGPVTAHAAATFTGQLPEMNYELTFEAKHVAGAKLGGVSFPIGKTHCRWMISGYDGTVSGLERIDGKDYRDNPTTRKVRIARGEWHAIRLRVTPEAIEGWVGSEQTLSFTGDLRLLGPILDDLGPGRLGYWTNGSKVALRNMRIRALPKSARRAGGATRPAAATKRAVGADGAVTLTVAAEVDGTSDLVVTPSGVYWQHVRGQRPGTPFEALRAKEPTLVNDAEWLPRWSEQRSDGHRVRGLPKNLAIYDATVDKTEGPGTVVILTVSPDRLAVRFRDSGDGAHAHAARLTLTPMASLDFEGAFAAGLRAIEMDNAAGAKAALDRIEKLRGGEVDPALLQKTYADAMTRAVAQAETAEWARLTRTLRFAGVSKPDSRDIATLEAWVKTASKPLFVDDFDSGKLSRWQVNSGTWTIERGQLAGQWGNDAMIFPRTAPLQDFILKCDVSSVGEKVGFLLGVVFRHTSKRWLYLFFNDGFDQVEGGGGVGPSFYHIGGPKAKDVRCGAVRYAVETGQRYRLTVRCTGRGFQGFVDGKRVLQGADERPTRGRLGLFATGAHARFDNVCVYRPVPLPPLEFQPEKP